MPRGVYAFTGTLLGPLMFAVGVLAAERPDAMAKPDDHETSMGSPTVNRASSIDWRDFCYISIGSSTIERYMRMNGVRVGLVRGDCKVTDTGGGEFEVESSFLVEDNPTPIRFTVLIVEGKSSIHDGDGWIKGKKEKIKLHGYHDDFVLISDFFPNWRPLGTVPYCDERGRRGFFCYP